MAVAAKYTKIWVDQFDFSDASNRVAANLSVAALPSTPFQVDAVEHIAGLTTGRIDHDGYYDGKGAGKLEQELQSRLATTSAIYVAALFGTNTAACPGYVTAQTWNDQLTVEMPIDGLITLTGGWPASGGLDRGLRVQDDAISAIGAGTAYDFSAQGTTGGVAYLFVRSITGTATNATIVVESSATQGGVYATEGTFTFSAVGVQKLTLSGTIDRWIRINTTSLGGATAFTVGCIVCVNGVTK